MEDSEYFSLTTFKQNGTLEQLEYAFKAVELGGQCVGIKAKNGSVIACESKLPSSLAERDVSSKIQKINDSVGCVYAGLSTDFHVLLKYIRKRAMKYKLRYDEDMPPCEVVKVAASIMQEYTQSGGVRPFGLSLLVIGWETKPTLWQVDASGSYWAWKATALGKRSENLKTFVERRYNDDLSVDDAIHTAISTLKEGFDGQLTADFIEIGIVGEDRKFRTLSTTNIRDFLTEV